MTGILHARSKEIFLEACELDREARADFVASACAGDPRLRAEVEALLASDSLPVAAFDSLDHGGGARALAAALATDPPEAAPDRIGEYRILRRIGEGGMGRVYEAEQDAPRRRVALKVLRDRVASPERLRRFEQEAHLLGRLNHPGIAHIYATGAQVSAGTRIPFIAMELVEGSTLDVFADSRALDVRARLDLFAQVCDAVQHAHQNGVLHRDLKPGNILVDPAGRPRVLDFGVARLLHGDERPSAAGTLAGAVVGTLRYMSPEQISATSDELDTRSDVYALGVIAYELLARRAPHELEGLALPQAARVVCEGEPQRLGAVDRALRGDIETIVAKAMEKDRERRYSSVAELAADVRRSLRDEPIVARPASALYHLGKFARRNTALVAGAGLAVATLIAATITSSWYARSEARQRAQAEQSARQNEELRTLADHNAYRASVLAVGLALRNDNPSFARHLLAGLAPAEPSWEHDRLRRMTEQWIGEIDVPIRFPWFVAFTPDGRSVVGTGRNGAAITWDLDGSRTVFALPDDASRARCGALSRDGAQAASIVGRTLRLWSTSDGRVLGELALDSDVDPYGASVAAFSRDRSRLALALRGRPVQLLDLPLAGVARPIAGVIGPLEGLAFSGDGRRLATLRNEVPHVWSTDDGSSLRRIEPVRLAGAVALDPTGALLAVGTENSIRLFDVEAGAASAVLPDLPDAVGSMEFDSDGTRLAVMLADQSVWVWNVRDGALEAKYWAGRNGFRTALAWSPDGERLATTAHTSDHVRLWDTRRTRRQEVLRGHSSYVYPVVYASDGRFLVSGSWDRTVRVWDGDTGAERHVLTGHSSRLNGLAPAPDSPRVAAATEGGELIVWDVEQGSALARASIQRPLASVAWSPDGSTLAVGTARAPAEIILFDALTLEARATLAGHGERVTSLAFDPRGRFLVSGGLDRQVQRWDLRTRERAGQRDAKLPVHCVCFSHDGRHLAVSGVSGHLETWDPQTLETTRRLVGHAREVFGAAFAPDGRRLFSGGRDGDLHVWDVESGDLVGQFEGHSDYIWSVAIHPGGRRVATGSGDSTVRQWESEPMSVTYERAR